MPEDIIVCEICAKTIFKYKCPKCYLKYCSVPCFKSHKEVGCEQRERPPDVQPKRVPGAQAHTSKDDIFKELRISTEERIPPAVLAKLGESKELKELLKNGTLRHMLAQLDGSKRKELAMFQCLQEGIFTEFADMCLQIIEPHNNNVSQMDTS